MRATMRASASPKARSVEARRERRIAVGHIERERCDADSPAEASAETPSASAGRRSRRAALHGGLVLRENALGPRRCATPASPGVLREDERRLAAEPHGLGRPREIRRVERQQQPMKAVRPGSGLRIVDAAHNADSTNATERRKFGREDRQAWREHGGAGQLYVVATPIGNLEDISPRALESLARADAIGRGDSASRAAARAPSRAGKTYGVHEHNERRAADSIVAQLAQGKTVALVTDAARPRYPIGATVVKKARAADSRWSRFQGRTPRDRALRIGHRGRPFLFAAFFRQDLPKGARRSRGSPGCRNACPLRGAAPRRRMRRDMSAALDRSARS